MVKNACVVLQVLTCLASHCHTLTSSEVSQLSHQYAPYAIAKLLQVVGQRSLQLQGTNSDDGTQFCDTLVSPANLHVWLWCALAELLPGRPEATMLRHHDDTMQYDVHFAAHQ